MHKDLGCVVYWLHDRNCECPWRHGYIGISARWEKRLKEHRYSKRWPEDFQATILFRGTEEECFALEMQFRPNHGIGWNPARGGNNNGRTLGYKHSDASRANVSKALRGRKKSEGWRRKLAAANKGKTRSPESRAKQSAAAKGRSKPEVWRNLMSKKAKLRYTDPNECLKMSLSVKKALKGVDRSGANNSRFGKPVSEATKEKMRQRIAERGGVDGPNNPNFKHGRYC
jgi:hypothetical protein